MQRVSLVSSTDFSNVFGGAMEIVWDDEREADREGSLSKTSLQEVRD